MEQKDLVMANNKSTGLISINTSYFFRGIAILMVIFSHYAEWGSASIPNEKLVHFVASLGDYGVGIFFFMSGYALFKGYGVKNTDKRYVIKRITNMYLPYLVIATATALLSKSIESIRDIVGLIKGDGYWFIEVIILIYIAFYFIGKLDPKYRVILMTLFILNLSLWYYLSGKNDFWYTANWAFALGMIVCKYENKIRLGREDFSINIKDYALCFIGKLTIYIYVAHAYVYFTFMSSGLLEGANFYIRLLVTILITIVVSYIIERLLYVFTRKIK